MLHKLDPKEIQSLANLSRLPHWEELQQCVRLEVDAIVKRMLATADPAILHECRGRANALNELLTAVNAASGDLEKIKVKLSGRP